MTQADPNVRREPCQVCGSDVELVGHWYIGDCGRMFEGTGECKNCGTKHEVDLPCRVQLVLSDAQKVALLKLARTQGKETQARFYSVLVRLSSGEVRWAGPLCLSREEAEVATEKKRRGEWPDGTDTPSGTEGKEYVAAPFTAPGSPFLEPVWPKTDVQ